MEEIQSIEFWKRALEESGHGVMVTDFDGAILSVNQNIVDLTGHSESVLLRSTPHILSSGQTPEAVYRDLWQTIRSGRTWKGAILNRKKDGTLFLDRQTILTAVGDHGDRACYVALHREANSELDLMLRLNRAEMKLGKVFEETDDAKAAIQTLTVLNSNQIESTSHALIAAVEAKDSYTAGHGRRTALLMELVGEELGLFHHCSRESVRIGAILHDVGKIGIPDAILSKQGALSDPEYEVVKTHPAIGIDIVRLAFTQEEVLRIVRHHHERLDGTGYPDGLKSHETPDYVKAFSVCDSFDAMTSSRSYRKAMNAQDALSVLTDEALLGRIDMAAVGAMKRLSWNGVLDDVLTIRKAA